jgi:hypothetical protein
MHLIFIFTPFPFFPLSIQRWSHIKRLDEDLTSGRAYGYTKEMSKILARGSSSFTFFPGSCLKPTTANLRLALVAEYLQAVLQEPQVCVCV